MIHTVSITVYSVSYTLSHVIRIASLIPLPFDHLMIERCFSFPEKRRTRNEIRFKTNFPARLAQ